MVRLLAVIEAWSTATAYWSVLRTMVFATLRTWLVNETISLRSLASSVTKNLPPHFFGVDLGGQTCLGDERELFT